MTLFVYSECGGIREANPVANAFAKSMPLLACSLWTPCAIYAEDVPHFHTLYCIATDSMSFTAGTWNETHGVLPLHKVFAVTAI
jgi:hypothetical protein